MENFVDERSGALRRTRLVRSAERSPSRSARGSGRGPPSGAENHCAPRGAEEETSGVKLKLRNGPTVVRSMPWQTDERSRELLLNREWLVTNGLGGYASGSVSGAITRKHHGILIAALPAPLGRTVMWSHVSEFLRFSDQEVV